MMAREDYLSAILTYKKVNNICARQLFLVLEKILKHELVQKHNYEISQLKTHNLNELANKLGMPKKFKRKFSNIEDYYKITSYPSEDFRMIGNKELWHCITAVNKSVEDLGYDLNKEVEGMLVARNIELEEDFIYKPKIENQSSTFNKQDQGKETL